jgi:hypothetical protein
MKTAVQIEFLNDKYEHGLLKQEIEKYGKEQC